VKLAGAHAHAWQLTAHGEGLQQSMAWHRQADVKQCTVDCAQLWCARAIYQR
jgi:hypothetical protein